MYFVCHIINGAGFWFPSDSVSVHPAIHPLNHLSSDDFSMSDFWCKKWLEGRTDGRTNIQLCCDMKIEFFSHRCYFFQSFVCWRIKIMVCMSVSASPKEECLLLFLWFINSFFFCTKPQNPFLFIFFCLVFLF